MNLVLTLQYYDGDRAEAERLARFIADLEPTKRSDVKVRLMARWDAKTLDMGAIQWLARKFDVSWAHSKKQMTGWPDGPNGVAHEVLTGSAEAFREIGWNEIDGVMLIEPDCVPLAKDWLNQIIAEWAVARAADKWIMGSWRASGPECGHINGNCVIVPDLASRIDFDRIPPHYAWDCHIAHRVKNHWHITGLIRNAFQSFNATEESLRIPEVGDRPPVLCHGFKDISCYEIARRWTA